MEERQLDGLWWLPGKEDIRIPGTMTFSPREGVKLVLQGAFRRLEQVGSSIPPTVILGVAGGTFVTLVDCLGSKQKLTMPGDLREEFFARLAYLGAHLTDPQDALFTKAKVKLTYLEDWVGRSGFDFDYEREGSHLKGFSLKYRYPEEVSANTRVGSIVISFGFTTKVDLLAKAEIGQSAHLRIETPEALPLDVWLRKLVGPLQDFLTLATRQPSGLTELTFQVESSTEGEAQAGAQVEDVEVLFRSRYVDAKGGSRLVRHDMLFTLNDLTSDFEVSLDAWLGAVDDLDSVCNLFFSVSYASEMYLHSQFLNFVQAAESYHRRRMSNEVLSRSDHRKRVDSVLAAVPDEHSEWLREQLDYSNEPPEAEVDRANVAGWPRGRALGRRQGRLHQANTRHAQLSYSLGPTAQGQGYYWARTV